MHDEVGAGVVGADAAETEGTDTLDDPVDEPVDVSAGKASSKEAGVRSGWVGWR